MKVIFFSLEGNFHLWYKVCANIRAVSLQEISYIEQLCHFEIFSKSASLTNCHKKHTISSTHKIYHHDLKVHIFLFQKLKFVGLDIPGIQNQNSTFAVISYSI